MPRSLEFEQNAKGGQAAGNSSGDDYSLRENNHIIFMSVTSVYLRHYIGIYVPNLCSKFSFSFIPPSETISTCETSQKRGLLVLCWSSLKAASDHC